MNHTPTLPGLALTGIVLLATTSVTAQELESGTGSPPDEIIVLGQLEETTPLTLARYGNRVEVISAAEIRAGGYNDLAQTLQMRAPGLYLAPKNGAFDYVDCSLQGSRCQDILWLIDGVRINNRLYNSTSPLDTIPAHMIERIEILYGGQGIFYGTQSVAGVVNIVTRPFSDESTGNASLGFDSNNGRHFAGDLAGTLGKHQFLLYASYDDADGFQPFSDSDYQPSATDRDRGYEVATAGIKYGVQLNDATRLRAHLHRTDNDVEFAAPASRARSFNERTEDLLTVKLDSRLADNFDMYVKAYYHSWDSYFSQFNNELDGAGQLTGNVVTISDQEYWGYEDSGITAVAEYRAAHGIDYIGGYELQNYSGRDDVLLIDDQEESVNAYFAQFRSGEKLFDNTQIAAGIRYNQPSGEGDTTVWNISGKHTFENDLYVRGSIGTAFRFPDAWQLYGNDPCCTLGNPDLEGEESQNINLAIGGTGTLFNSLTWEVTVFDRDVENLIGSANGVRTNTDAQVRFEGFEVSLRAALNDSWSLFANYTNTKAREEGSDEQIVDIPKTLFKTSLDYQGHALPVDFSLAASWVGAVYSNVAGGIGRTEHGDYLVLDVSGGWTLDRAGKHRIGLRIENLLEKDYATSMSRAFRDSDGTSYAYANLGTPQTLHVNYHYRF